jgi:PAS domain S-box-containing protein
MEQDATAVMQAPDPAAQDPYPPSSLMDAQELACRWQPDTTLTYVNETYCRYFGKSEAELIGQSFLSLVPDEEPATLAVHFQKLVASLTVDRPFSTTQHRVVTSSGQLHWQEWSTGMSSNSVCISC